MKKSDEIKFLEKQFLAAIDARNKLQDNYHKWMTFYYVANGALLVAITTLYSKAPISVQPSAIGVAALTGLGILTCMIWNLSCKGYYHWSLSWMDIIMYLERKLANNDKNVMIYNTFSSNVTDNSFMPTKPANISTPKLTLFFSAVCIVCWAIFGFVQICPCQISILCSLLELAGLLAVVYGVHVALAKLLKSRTDSHIMVDYNSMAKEEIA
jgi:hypothetical protein